MAFIAAALTAGLVIAFLARGRQLARLEANETLNAFREDLVAAQVLLYGQNADRAQREEGTGRCWKALGHYQVLSDKTWDQQPAVAYLPAGEQRRLHADVAEALFMAGRITADDAENQGREGVEPQGLTLALKYDRAALGCYTDGNAPRALWEHGAILLARLGDEVESNRFSERARETPATSARDFYLAAQVHMKQGEFRKALPLLEDAIRRDPRNFPAWFVKANCHDGLMQLPEAAAFYGTCIALRPSDARVWFNRGLARLRLGDHAQALADFDEAIA